MVPSATAISESAISGLPDSAYSYVAVEMSADVRFEGVAHSPYREFVTNPNVVKVYAVEVTAQTLQEV